MAQKLIVESVDDIDGSQADEHVLFGLDGVDFEIDLSERNAKVLREKLSPFVSGARRVGGRRKPRPKASSGITTETEQETRERNLLIRSWARKNGWEVSDRGRLPADVVEAYEKAAK